MKAKRFEPLTPIELAELDKVAADYPNILGLLRRVPESEHYRKQPRGASPDIPTAELIRAAYNSVVMGRERNYSVVGINGFRQSNLTKDQAIFLARKMQRQMRDAGWAGNVRVHYRDGSLVEFREVSDA